MDDRFGEDDEEHADGAEKNHVVKAGAPDGSFRPFRLLGSEVLADESGRGVAEAPARHKDENEDADGDGVAGKGSGAEDADDAHEADPTGMRDGELQDARERHAQEAKQDAEIEMDLAAEDADALGAAEETPSLGKGPQPKMRQGSRTRLMMLETQSKRMAMAASPAPRKMALLRKRSMMAPLPPRAMRA